MKRFALLGAACALVIVGAACVPVTPPPPPPPPPPPAGSPTLAVNTSFEVDNVGLGPVWDIAFVPGSSGDLFFSRRSGVIRYRTAAGAKSTVQNPVPEIRSTGEGGLMGLAVDPDFATNRYLFACYSHRDAAAPNATDNRVVRFTVNATFDGVDAVQPIVVGMPHNDGASGRHSGCRLRFKPGTDELFVGTGDAAMGPTPQSGTSLGGKTLRITRDGAPYPGNPTVGDGRIWTYGHRNVQGITFRPSDLQPFSAEHGTGCDDEINKLIAGKNGGWDPNNGGSYDESRPMTNLGLPNAIAPMWASGCPTLAPSGAAFLDGAQWEGWNGALAVAMLKTQKLTIMFMNANGNVTSTFDTLQNGVRLRSPVQGPDGSLYVGTDDGRIWRVTPS